MRSRAIRRSWTSSISDRHAVDSTTSPCSGRRPSASNARSGERAGPAREVGADGLVEVVDRHRASDRDRAVVDHVSRVGQVVLVLDLADELLEDVLEGHDARPFRRTRRRPARSAGAPRAARAGARRGPWSRHHERLRAPASRRSRRAAAAIGRGSGRPRRGGRATRRRPGSARAACSTPPASASSAVSGLHPDHVGRGHHHVARLAPGEVEDVVQQLLLRARDHAEPSASSMTGRSSSGGAPTRPPSPR